MKRLFFASFWAASYALGAGCNYPGDITSGLDTKEGYVEFIKPAKLNPLKAALPKVAHAETQAILNSPDTMWYDEESMIFTYQDSVEVVTGTRANCVGRQVGEANQGSVIGKLVNLFGPDFRFRFPFRKVAGTDNVDNLIAINFWSPPRRDGRVLPVRYWKNGNRAHWYWTFPIGTVFGEVLYQKAPNGMPYVFEIRTRKRYADGWFTNAFRPFGRASELADAIEKRRPNWKNYRDLKGYVSHLRDKNTLTPLRWESKPYGKIFPAIDGSLDKLPEIGDTSVLIELLTQTPFTSVEGKIWKENGKLETYAPSSQTDFNIVPKNYELGMVAVNEISCNRCHTEVSHRLGDFENDLQLYGEIWGEDRIFTWHPFQVKREIFGTFDESDGSRILNPRFTQAKLVQNGKPSSEADYKPLPSAWVPYPNVDNEN